MTETLNTLKDDLTPADPPFPKRAIYAGFLVLASLVALFSTWAFLAPIKSAVIAPGVVSVDSHRKKIQHLEGGIIKKIHVRDGDYVEAGQVLVKLGDVVASANVARLQAQYYEALALTAQYIAERDGLEEIRFPKELTEAGDNAAQAAMHAQTRVFKSQKELLTHTLSVMKQKLLQSEEEVNGLTGQLKAIELQLNYFAEEMKSAKKLFRKKLTPHSRLLKLQREMAELEGDRAKMQANIAQTKQRILELDLKSTELKSARVAHAVENLREQRTKAYEISRRLIPARDQLQRTEIRAPIEGTVVNVQIHSRDGVVRTGDTLMEIVPSSDQLVVEARLRPEDRDEVRAGLEAYVQLTSMGRRDARPIRGILSSISADRLTEDDRPFYLVRVQLDPESVKQQAVAVLAGMGADVFIQTGERTAFQYLTAPITRTMQRGLREQ